MGLSGPVGVLRLWFLTHFTLKSPGDNSDGQRDQRQTEQSGVILSGNHLNWRATFLPNLSTVGINDGEMMTSQCDDDDAARWSRLPVKIYGAVTGHLPVDDGPLALTLFCTFCCLYAFMMVSPCCFRPDWCHSDGQWCLSDQRRTVSGVQGRPSL